MHQRLAIKLLVDGCCCCTRPATHKTASSKQLAFRAMYMVYIYVYIDIYRDRGTLARADCAHISYINVESLAASASRVAFAVAIAPKCSCKL